jgi:hypothetical protein
MKQLLSNIKRMPVDTWNWFGVNNKDITLYAHGNEDAERCFGNTQTFHDSHLEHSFEEFQPHNKKYFFTNEKTDYFIDENKNKCRYFKIPKGHIENIPIILSYRLGENSSLTDDTVIEAEEGSSVTFIIKYISERGNKSHHCGRTRIFAKKNSSVKIITAQLLGEETTHADITEGIAGEGAQIHVIYAEMGAADTVSSCNLVLEGNESNANLDILYLGNSTRSLDISTRIEHKGKKSLSNIRANGVMLNKSQKILRDTIDFISGSSGSKGREEENVLMLDSNVKNVSVPILLCGEDDVEGEHAATSGRPSDSLMFYLMNRGLSEKEAEKLLAEAAFASVLEAVPDKYTREEILEVLHSSILKEGKTYEQIH